MNQSDGDGCSNCLIDSGYICSGLPSVCTLCGNGQIDSGEECDDSSDICQNCILNEAKIESQETVKSGQAMS